MDRIENLRARALDRAERTERQFKLTIVAAAVVEAVFLVALVWLVDFSDRTHLVILVATVMTYSLIGIGLAALGAHVNRVGLRILRALDGQAGTSA